MGPAGSLSPPREFCPGRRPGAVHGKGLLAEGPHFTPSRLEQLVQGLLIGRLSRHFSEEALLRTSVLVFMLVGLAMVSVLPARPWALHLPTAPLGVTGAGSPLSRRRVPLQAFMSTVVHFCLLMPGFTFSFCLLSVVTDSMLTKAVSPSDTGGHPASQPRASLC